MIMRVLLLIFVTISVNANQSFIEASISDKTILLEVANTQALRSKGLMGIKELDDNQGMIFIWPGAARRCMWMKNTYIELSVAFINREKKIVEIFDLEPGSLDSVCSVNRDIIAAVEMNKGWFAKNRIELFSRIALP
tara:strand:+ start:12810 stop:13220 length:411 start_codon:yes stop_codon:yes gene_type:complete